MTKRRRRRRINAHHFHICTIRIREKKADDKMMKNKNNSALLIQLKVEK